MSGVDIVRQSYRAGMRDGLRDVALGVPPRPADALASAGEQRAPKSYIAGYVQSYKDAADQAGRLALSQIGDS